MITAVSVPLFGTISKMRAGPLERQSYYFPSPYLGLSLKWEYAWRCEQASLFPSPNFGLFLKYKKYS